MTWLGVKRWITRRGEPSARRAAIRAGEKRAFGIDRGRLVVPEVIEHVTAARK